MKNADDNELPRDLEGVHRELSGIRIEERPSFAPELESELESAAVSLISVRRRQGRVRRTVLAAGAAGVLAMAAVPGARAALVRVWDMVLAPASTQVATPAPVEAAPAAPVITQFVPLEEAEDVPPEPATSPAWTDRDLDEIRPTFAYPKLRDIEESERIIAMFYPTRLQQRGIGGSVQVMLWVDENGVVRDRQVLEPSGDRTLDRAALNASGRLRFEPARRQGVPVGSWVKFNIQFEPPNQPGIVRPSIYEDESDAVEVPADRAADTAGAQPGN